MELVEHTYLNISIGIGIIAYEKQKTIKVKQPKVKKEVKQGGFFSRDHAAKPVKNISKLEEKLSSGVGRKISISQNKKKPGTGKLEIEYYNEEDFEALVKLLCGNDILNDN